MAKYKKLQLGSEGVEVTELQNKLNDNGANLTVIIGLLGGIDTPKIAFK